MTLQLSKVYANKPLFSFKLFGKDIHFKIHGGVMYIMFEDITELLEIDLDTYIKKRDQNAEEKYPTVRFDDNHNSVFITISTLMRFLSDINSALGHFKENEDKPSFEQTPYKIHQLYLAFK